MFSCKESRKNDEIKKQLYFFFFFVNKKITAQENLALYEIIAEK